MARRRANTKTSGREAMLLSGQAAGGDPGAVGSFCKAIAAGRTSDGAGIDAGVSPAVGVRWFRRAGRHGAVAFVAKFKATFRALFCHLPSEKRSRSFTLRSEALARLRASWGDRLRPSPANCVAMPRRALAAPITAPQPPNGMRIDRLDDRNHRSWRRIPVCSSMFRTGCPEKSGLTMARKYRGLRSNGKAGRRDRGKVAAGRPPGVQSRSLADYHWTSPTTRRCGSVTKRSIKPCSFKDVAHSDAN